MPAGVAGGLDLSGWAGGTALRAVVNPERYTPFLWMTETDFEISSREALLWLRAADTRRRAARLIKGPLDAALEEWNHDRAKDEDIWIWEDYLLLCAFAIENLLKGILIGRNPSWVAEGRLKWPGGPHDLSRLADEVEIPLCEEERELLVRLTEVIAWSGRYPVPYQEKRLGRTSKIGDRRRQATTYVTTDERVFDDLYGKLENQLKTERSERDL